RVRRGGLCRAGRRTGGCAMTKAPPPIEASSSTRSCRQRHRHRGEVPRRQTRLRLALTWGEAPAFAGCSTAFRASCSVAGRNPGASSVYSWSIRDPQNHNQRTPEREPRTPNPEPPSAPAAENADERSTAQLLEREAALVDRLRFADRAAVQRAQEIVQ